MVDAVCRIVAACRKTLTLSVVQDGFIKTGQWDTSLMSYNFDKKMACCTSFIQPHDLDVMREKLPELAGYMKSQGFVTEAQMDEAGIPTVSDGRAKPKDARPFHQNRALLLNTDANLAKVRVPDPELAPMRRDGLKQLRAELKRKNREALNEFSANQKRQAVEAINLLKQQRAATRKAATAAKRTRVLVEKNSEMDRNVRLNYLPLSHPCYSLPKFMLYLLHLLFLYSLN